MRRTPIVLSPSCHPYRPVVTPIALSPLTLPLPLAAAERAGRERRAARPRRGLRQCGFEGKVRARLRRRMGQGHDARSVRSRLMHDASFEADVTGLAGSPASPVLVGVLALCRQGACPEYGDTRVVPVHSAACNGYILRSVTSTSCGSSRGRSTDRITGRASMGCRVRAHAQCLNRGLPVPCSL